MKKYINTISPERRKESWIKEWIRKQKSDPELKQLDQNQRLNKKSNVLTIHIRPVVDFTNNKYTNIVKIQVGTAIGCNAFHIVYRKMKWLSDCYTNALRRYLEDNGVIRQSVNNNKNNNNNKRPVSAPASALKSETIRYRNGLKDFINSV